MKDTNFCEQEYCNTTSFSFTDICSKLGEE